MKSVPILLAVAVLVASCAPPPSPEQLAACKTPYVAFLHPIFACQPRSPPPLPLSAPLAEPEGNPSWSDAEGVAAFNRGDYATALRIFRLLAAIGDPAAQTNLGIMYEEGKGVTQDYATAVKWYRAAAAHLFAQAQYLLGVAYLHGTGVSKDHEEALKWFRLAAAQGYGHAQAMLASMHSNGQGVTQSTPTTPPPSAPAASRAGTSDIAQAGSSAQPSIGCTPFRTPQGFTAYDCHMQIPAQPVEAHWNAQGPIEAPLVPPDLCTAGTFTTKYSQPEWQQNFALEASDGYYAVFYGDSRWSLPDNIGGSLFLTVGTYGLSLGIESNHNAGVRAGITLEQLLAVIDAMNQATSMTVEFGKSTYTMSLDGSSAATAEFLSCAGITPPPNPFH